MFLDIKAAAEKLGVTVETLRHAVEGDVISFAGYSIPIFRHGKSGRNGLGRMLIKEADLQPLLDATPIEKVKTEAPAPVVVDVVKKRKADIEDFRFKFMKD